jgi:hypothetical protein
MTANHHRGRFHRAARGGECTPMNPSLATVMLGQQIHRDRLRKPRHKK